MSMLMLYNKTPAILANQPNENWESLYSTPAAGEPR